MRLGIVARSDKSGLGNQTRNLVELLKPERILLIDSTSFNGHKQYPEIYDGYKVLHSDGFIDRGTAIEFVKSVDAILSCETFYSDYLIRYAMQYNVKTFNQFNYEFLDYLNGNHPMVTTLVAPSTWHLEELQEKFGNVVYLPPPTDPMKFADARRENLSRVGKKRFLHIVGNGAYNDRNGTKSLIQAVSKVKGDFELVIKTQIPIKIDDMDKRITIDDSSPDNEAELYFDFDAMIMPRRYGGLCLPMNEALLSALPVIMTDVEPNNKILPPEWLVKSEKTGELMTRTIIDVYSADQKELAKKIEWLLEQDGSYIKQRAFEVGYSNFSTDVLQSKWKELVR